MNLTSEKQRVLLISILQKNVSDSEALVNLRETKQLIEAYGAELTDAIIQRREVHDKGRYIGAGKIKHAGEIIKREQIDIVVLNDIVKPGDLFDMKKIWWKNKPNIEVWDRVDLILQIFSKHANTAEARLQIDLAAMRHMGPRIFGMGMVLSRQSGGIGGRGIGETNTELMKRHWRSQMKKAKDKLFKLSEERERQLERRRRNGVKTISLVGYTNAGKTSLFNLLTGKKNLVENALFATLDSATGKIFLPEFNEEILLSDTIGFIQNLPTELIDAFKSTLLESTHADLLLHVIDVSDPNYKKKILVVENILQDLGIHKTKKIYVFNKTETVDPALLSDLKEDYEYFTPQFVSVKKESGIEALLTQIKQSLYHTDPIKVHIE